MSTNQATKALFMHTRSDLGRALAVHATLMKAFDRRHVQPYAVYNSRRWDGTRSRAGAGEVPEMLRDVPGLVIRPVDFGPRLGRVSKLRAAIEAARTAVPTVTEGIRLVRWARRTGIDVIHSEHASRDALYGWVLARLTGAKFVLHMHIKYADWLSPFSRWAIRRADGVIAVSEWVKAGLVEAGIEPQAIFTVYNGIDVRGFDPEVADGTPVRDEFEVDSRTALVAMVAHLHPWKGHMTLLRALTRVVNTHPRIKVLIVGEQDPHVGGLVRDVYPQQLREFVRVAGLQHRVVFTGQRPDISAILAAADIFTMPASDEPFGLVFVEAMCMAKPVLALDVAGTPEVVADGTTGLLSPEADDERLAENLASLLDDPVRRTEMGACGRLRALDRFTAERMAGGVAEVYRSVTSTRRIGHPTMPMHGTRARR